MLGLLCEVRKPQQERKDATKTLSDTENNTNSGKFVCVFFQSSV